ncbi:putative ATP-dependent helicase DinG [Pirellula sp. SH-Sr6A]|uniref:ATP-dependent DNA helicase n=1 Tax=Pirellula sp. SH-Sr6A TaxID=1632865 RepID=UPI00078E4293|nr:helicase C-terminal domain-containing protein [Pirellula sp. SH-Sr6A]AMV33092.1 putative ATP-dependent helicase DinG [Pirellula sp. SH-Sr6A]
MTSLDIHSILGPEGNIARRIRNYEHRREQLQMAEAVEKALHDGHHLVVEAGTGVGKSFGYLVPAILFATQAEGRMDSPPSPRLSRKDQEELGGSDKEEEKIRRVIVSTHTISLQEQLVAKDLPLLKAVIPREFTSVLVKGRGNYLSKRRLGLAMSRAASLLQSDRDYDQLEQIALWNKETHEGSLSSLPFKPSMSVWDEVASDSGNCMGRKCDHFNECFYYAARRRVHNSQILVVNHALFFSDLALRAQGAGMLPEYDAVIFDESHTIESVAGEHLGLQISNSQIDYTLRKLFNPRNDKGILSALGLKQLTRETYRCMESLDALSEDLLSWLANSASGNGRVYDLLEVQTDLPVLLQSLSEQLERFGQDLKNANDRLELMSASKRLTALANTLDQWLKQKETDAVYWLEKSESRSQFGRGSVRITLRSSPIDISKHLKTALFDKVRTVVLTSATLSTGKSQGFQFFQKRIGALKAAALQVGSPFDYKRLARLELVTDLPDPSQDKANYEKKVLPTIRHYVAAHEGRAFILFTSYDMLRKTCDALRPWMLERGLAVYSQADGTPRTQLLQDFKANPRGVLFGAESFWQGVDVPGDALQLVIISKLPFSVPDHPLLEAKLEDIRRKGGNPFRDYQLPEAVIKFKQGFGRLIRTATDSGVVLVTDPRIVTKPYGRLFVESLPDCQVIHVQAKAEP